MVFNPVAAATGSLLTKKRLSNELAGSGGPFEVP
jgi:hypothetical protein